KKSSTIHRRAGKERSSTHPCGQQIRTRRIRIDDIGDTAHLSAHTESITHTHADHRRTTPRLRPTDLGHRHTTAVHPEGPATPRSPEEAVVPSVADLLLCTDLMTHVVPVPTVSISWESAARLSPTELQHRHIRHHNADSKE